jgi:hypothetical protein
MQLIRKIFYDIVQCVTKRSSHTAGPAYTYFPLETPPIPPSPMEYVLQDQERDILQPWELKMRLEAAVKEQEEESPEHPETLPWMVMCRTEVYTQSFSRPPTPPPTPPTLRPAYRQL